MKNAFLAQQDAKIITYAIKTMEDLIDSADDTITTLDLIKFPTFK